MDKKILGEVLSSLVPNQTIQLQMRGRTAPDTFVVLESKKGRGKGGSRVATIQRTDGTVITIGTPKHLDVLNITNNGQFYGVQNERAEPPVYPTNDAQAVAFKTGVKTALSKEPTGRMLRLEATVPHFNGTFQIIDAKNEKGKHGQLHLWLVPEGQAATAENTVEVWSHRHSGIITSFEILN